MLLNYLKLSLRLLARNPFFTFINVLGLAVGFSVFIFLWQYSQNELNSDRMWKDWQRIARMGFVWTYNDNDGKGWRDVLCGAQPGRIAPQLKQDFPELEDVTRTSGIQSPLLISRVHNQQKVTFKEEKVVFADANFFAFFDVPFLYGDARESLAHGNSVSVSHSTALRYFGERNPLGEILVMNDTLSLRVAGVFQDFPDNSHFDFDIAISNERHLNEWSALVIFPWRQTFVKARSVIDWTIFEEKVDLLKGKYWRELERRHGAGEVKRMIVEPLPDVVFSGGRGNPFQQKSRSMLIILGLTGLVVLIIAWINYILLALSRSKKRMNEMGVRKVAGASFRDFAGQFITEALVVNLVSLALGITLLQFIGGTGKLVFDLPFYGLEGADNGTLAILILFLLAGIVTSGLYPALVSAKYNPSALFRIRTGLSKGGRVVHWFNTVQYVFATILILWTFTVYLQLDYVISKSRNDAGDAVVVVEAPILRSHGYLSKMEHFENQFAFIDGILDKTVSRSVLGDESYESLEVYQPGKTHWVGIDTHGGVDENFIPMFHIQLIAGRNFISTDKTNAIILSEGALQRLGFDTPAGAVGAKVKVGEPYHTEMEIIGVIKGYPFRPYFFDYSDVERAEADHGVALTVRNYQAENFSPERIIVKVDPQKVEVILSKAKRAFEVAFPGNIFHWYWADEHVTRHYQREKTNRSQIIVFTCIAIGIACLGLLGMMSHKVLEKTKEIGIRKILGAQLRHIALVLLRSTFRQVVISLALAYPAAYYLMGRYLERFSERITLQWWQFAIPVAMLLLIMLVTVATVVWRAAKSNPVEALKYE